MFTFLEPYIYTNSLNFVIGRLYAEPCLCNRLYIHVSKTMNLLYTYILFGPISRGLLGYQVGSKGVLFVLPP